MIGTAAPRQTWSLALVVRRSVGLGVSLFLLLCLSSARRHSTYGLVPSSRDILGTHPLPLALEPSRLHSMFSWRMRV